MEIDDNEKRDLLTAIAAGTAFRLKHLVEDVIEVIREGEDWHDENYRENVAITIQDQLDEIFGGYEE
jgi:hypothetical protein